MVGLGYSQNLLSIMKVIGFGQLEQVLSSTDIPNNPSVSINSTEGFQAGSFVKLSALPAGFTQTGIYQASSDWKGEFNAKSAYSSGNVVYDGSNWVRLNVTHHHGQWQGQNMAVTINDGDYVEHDGNIYEATSGGTTANLYTARPDDGSGTWTLVGDAMSPTTGFGAGNIQTVTANTAGDATSLDTYFTFAPWQLAEPDTGNGGRVDVTSKLPISIIH